MSYIDNRELFSRIKTLARDVNKSQYDFQSDARISIRPSGGRALFTAKMQKYKFF